MYYDSEQKTRILSVQFIIKSMAVLLASTVLIIGIEYLISYREGSTYYFSVKKRHYYIPQGDSTAMQEKWKVTAELQQHEYIFKSKIPLLKTEHVKEMSSESSDTVFLSRDCLLSNIFSNADNGLVAGCSNGLLRIFYPTESDSIEMSSFQLPGTILTGTWYNKRPVLLVLNNDSPSPLEQNVDLYQYKFQGGSWRIDAVKPREFSIEKIPSLFTVNDVGIYFNSAQGIVKLSEKSHAIIDAHSLLQYAGGNHDFHLVHSSLENLHKLSIYINNAIEFSIPQRTDATALNSIYIMSDTASAAPAFIIYHIINNKEEAHREEIYRVELRNE